MATFSRSSTTDWEGGLMDGKGVAKAGTGAFSLPVTFPVRIGEPEGKTSPEELMAAAHAACFAMAMTLEEALVGATLNAAWALDRADAVGSLEPGKLMDAVVVNGQLGELLRVGSPSIRMVIKRGKVVWVQ